MHTRFFAAKNDSERENVSLQILLVALLALFLFPLSAFAQCGTSWTGGGSGVWNAAGNWSAGVPTSSTNACISTANSIVTLNISGAATSNLTLGVTDTLSFNNGATLTVSGSTISNAGSITMNGSANTTALEINAANVTLSGGGTLTLSNFASNIIGGSSGTDVLTNQETIQGAGNIGVGQIGLNNQGTIDANQSVGMTLQVSSAGGTNTGTLEASAGSKLTFFGGTYANAGGTILNNASTILFDGGVTINGGTITQTGAGLIQLADVTINTALSNNGTSTIEVIGGGNTVSGTLTNPTGGVLQIDNGGILNITGSSIVNNGTFTMNGSANTTALEINAANVTLSGSGTLTLSNFASNIIGGSSGTDVLTNQETIQGAGNIGVGQIGLNNQGTIDANQSVGMTLQVSSAGGTNTGTLEASAGSKLTFFGGTYANAGGTILNNASTILFDGGVTINGGTITQTGAGLIQLANATINTALSNNGTSTIEVIGGGNTVSGTLTNPTGGMLQIDNGGILNITGSSIVNNGTFTMNGSANTTALEIDAANVTLSGGGTLTLSNFASNIIGGSSGTDVLTNQETIQGAGNIGVGQIGLNNQGTIDANQSVGMTLQVSSAGGTNTGTLEASAGSKLTFFGGTYANAGGTILNNASTILFDGGVTINGGTITQTGAGLIQLADVTINTALANNGTSTIEVIGGGNTVSGTLTNPAGGQLKLDNGGILNITGSSIVNNGTFTMNGSANTTALEIDAANVTLSGSGTLTLSNFASNIIGGSSGTDVLTNQETIQGAGNIGVGQIGLNNQGTIDANQSVGMTLQVSSAGGTNTGTLEASAGSKLTFFGGTYANAGGTILNNASTILFDGGVTINGGTITQTGAGLIQLADVTINTALANNGTSTIEVIGGGNTVSGTLTNPTGGMLQIDNGGILNITGSSIVNNGTFTMNGSANTTALEINAANVTLSGGGTLTLSNFASNIIGGSSGTDVLTNQETIQGAGNIGVGQIGLNNQGTIDANQSVGMTLQVSSAGGTNTGTLEASAGSKLTFFGGTYANAGGTILNNASTILFDGGVTINGGTITQTGAGLIQLADVTINTALANNGTSTIEVIGGGTRYRGR